MKTISRRSFIATICSFVGAKLSGISVPKAEPSVPKAEPFNIKKIRVVARSRGIRAEYMYNISPDINLELFHDLDDAELNELQLYKRMTSPEED